MEEGKISLVRAAASETYPSDFMLVCAMNPCKCGWYGHPSGRCRCSPASVRKYLGRLSGPLLDRIDLYAEVPALEFEELADRSPGEDSAPIRERVLKARAVQTARFGPDGPPCNAAMGQEELKRYCALDEAGVAIMKGAYEHMGLTARSYDRILRVARTIADLDGDQQIAAHHLAEAIQYRESDYFQT
jgi:magnesium chelatase family protein